MLDMPGLHSKDIDHGSSRCDSASCWLFIAVTAFVWLEIGVGHPAWGHDRPSGPPHKTRSAVMGRQGMAATSQPLATATAIRILQQGGNAVDAAIAANAVLGVVEPMSCGLGGDLFAIVWDARSKKLFGVNASGRAPAAATLDFFKAKELKTIPTYGPLSWSVPGCVDGWDQLRRRFGTKPLSELLEPAIAYAENGFPVSEIIAADWRAAEPSLQKIPSSARCFLPGGHAPEPGSVFRNPALAGSLRTIARDGRDAFYRGPLAEKIVRYSQSAGGLFALSDFSEHTTTFVDPVSTNYRGYDVWELPPNGQGIAALQMLNILESYDLKSLGPQTAETLHLMIEAKKLAYEDRAKYYADPEFAHSPVSSLISKPYAAQRRAQLKTDQANLAPAPGEPLQADTIYLTVVDREFNCVSLIQSNFHGFGSHHVPGEPGFRASKPRFAVRARPQPSQPARAAQAPVPHDHPGFCDQGWDAVAELWPDGRRHAGTGPCASHLQLDRLRHGRPGSRRCAAVPSLRVVGADGTACRGGRVGGSRVGNLGRRTRAGSRPRGIAWPRPPAPTEATRPFASIGNTVS